MLMHGFLGLAKYIPRTRYFNGITIIVRYPWISESNGSKAFAKWQQAFSTDKGNTPKRFSRSCNATWLLTSRRAALGVSIP